MLDLNLDHVFSIDSPCNNSQKRKITHIQDSSPETSSSSIINNSEESTTIEDSSDNTNNNNNKKKQHQVFIFDIMKTNSTTTSQSHDPLLIEQPLFPLNGGLGLSFSTPPRPQFLNLSCGETEQQKQLLPLQQQQPPKKSRRGPRSRSSQYRGVTFYRRTGRWESHIWDCGKQVYLGGFDTAHAAARAYDRAAIKFRGVDADINFILSDYDEDMKQMGNLNKEDFVHILRRQSTGFLRGNSKYRGPKEVRMAQFGCNNTYGKVEPSVYQPQILTGAINNGGVGRNLDLSLRISIPENPMTQSVDNSVLRSLQQTHAAAPIMWNTTFLPSAPNCMEVRSSQSVSSWASRMPDNMNITLAPRLPIAASSGFASSSLFSPSPTSLSSNLHNHLANRLHLNTTTAAAHKVSGTSTNQLHNNRS